MNDKNEKWTYIIIGIIVAFGLMSYLSGDSGRDMNDCLDHHSYSYCYPKGS